MGVRVHATGPSLERLPDGSGRVRFRWRTRPSDRLAWTVAFATGSQSLLQAIDAQMQGSWPRFWVWLVGTFAIGGFVGWAETVKRFAGE